MDLHNVYADSLGISYLFRHHQTQNVKWNYKKSKCLLFVINRIYCRTKTFPIIMNSTIIIRRIPCISFFFHSIFLVSFYRISSEIPTRTHQPSIYLATWPSIAIFISLLAIQCPSFWSCSLDYYFSYLRTSNKVKIQYISNKKTQRWPASLDKSQRSIAYIQSARSTNIGCVFSTFDFEMSSHEFIIWILVVRLSVSFYGISDRSLFVYVYSCR